MNSADLDESFRPYLQSGERIVWRGRPATGIRFSARDVFLIPFSLLWGGFAIFWESSVLFISAQSVAGAPFALFGVPFVLVGLYMIFGRFIVDAWVRSRMIYALTNQRALILRRLFGDRLTAVALANAPQLRLSVRGDRGDIDFDSPAAFSSFFGAGRSWGLWMPSLDGAARFIGVENPGEVFRLAQDAARRP